MIKFPWNYPLIFFFLIAFLILVVLLFGISLLFSWVLTQNPLWQIFLILLWKYGKSFLFYDESKWLLDMKIRGLYKAYFFSITFCFIDDLCAINDHLEFIGTLRMCILPRKCYIWDGMITIKCQFWNANYSFVELMVSITSGVSLCCRPCYKNMLDYNSNNKCQKLTTIWK